MALKKAGATRCGTFRKVRNLASTHAGSKFMGLYLALPFSCCSHPEFIVLRAEVHINIACDEAWPAATRSCTPEKKRVQGCRRGIDIEVLQEVQDGAGPSVLGGGVQPYPTSRGGTLLACHRWWDAQNFLCVVYLCATVL